MADVYSVRLSRQHSRRLNDLARRLRTTRSDVVRRLIDGAVTRREREARERAEAASVAAEKEQQEAVQNDKVSVTIELTDEAMQRLERASRRECRSHAQVILSELRTQSRLLRGTL